MCVVVWRMVSCCICRGVLNAYNANDFYITPFWKLLLSPSVQCSVKLWLESGFYFIWTSESLSTSVGIELALASDWALALSIIDADEGIWPSYLHFWLS